MSCRFIKSKTWESYFQVYTLNHDGKFKKPSNFGENQMVVNVADQQHYFYFSFPPPFLSPQLITMQKWRN